MQEEEVDASNIERSGQVCVIGVPNSGKSSLVNALVGAKVSIVSDKPQTTRQRVMGLALLAPIPGQAPNTQAVFVDTAGIMQLTALQMDNGGVYRKRVKKVFHLNKLHKAMVKTAWKATREADVLFWVLDAAKCLNYGDYMPESPMLDGIAVGPPVRDAWWLHPELEEELALLRKFRALKRPVSVILNKMDVLRENKIDADKFAVEMLERLKDDLGSTEDGEEVLQNLWPTSVLKSPESLAPIKKWLCENLPQQSPIYPLASVSDAPARVAASEITREKLFEVLQRELPYSVAVINAVWMETPSGTLKLGQKVVVKRQGEAKIVYHWLKRLSRDIEKEISATLNFDRPVELHFRTVVDKDWQEKEEYYNDLQGVLYHGGSLLFPG